MPIKHDIDLRNNMLLVRRWGHITTHDEGLACEERANDDRISPGMPVLVDCREVEPADSTETVKYLADCVTSLASDLACGPVAIVVSSDVEYGMARMYMAYTELSHPNTEVFRDIESAREWLQHEKKNQ